MFAFYYLRELNLSGQWRPKGVNPPIGFGVVILVLVLLSAAVYWAGFRARRSSGPGSTWHLAAGLSFLLGLAALVVMCVLIPNAGFRPTSGSYASVFFAWIGFYAFVYFGGLYYLETVLAKSLRNHSTAAQVVAGAEAEAFGVFWIFMAAVQVLMFALLFLVA